MSTHIIYKNSHLSLYDPCLIDHHKIFNMGSKIVTLIFLFFVAKLLFVNGVPKVPCYFIFGDSLMDNGNNNDLETEAKANYAPYGIDFPDGPTGRFSNGRNIPDVIAELLGFENFIPPFATARLEEIFQGVNYASASAGIRDETGQHMGDRISLKEQLRRHRITILRLSQLIGDPSLAQVRQYLKKCIYTVGMGNNDYINNYFLPQYYQTSSVYTPEQYANILVRRYRRHLMKLYNYGARKFGIFGAGYSGCTPAMMAKFGTNTTCVDVINNAIVLFNTKLSTTLNDLNDKLGDAKFIFIEPPLGYSSDLNVTDKPCCKVSTTVGKGQCAPNQLPCKARQNYVFWDAFHPTEKVSLVDGAKAYEALSPFYAFPTVLRSKADYVDVFKA